MIGAEVLEFTISASLCTSEVLLVEVDSYGIESIHSGTIITLTEDTTAIAP